MLVELLRQHARAEGAALLVVSGSTRAAAASTKHGLEGCGELSRANVLQSVHEKPEVDRFSSRVLIGYSSRSVARSGGRHLNQAAVLRENEPVCLSDTPQEWQNIRAHHRLLYVQRDLTDRKITIHDIQSAGFRERRNDDPKIDVLEVDQRAAIRELHGRCVLRATSLDWKDQDCN